MRKLEDKRILITAGPTREFIDPVRYISNPSTGRMGVAISYAAQDLGAKVTLILGPSEVRVPEGLELIRILTADDMYDEVYSKAPDADIIIMTAAVSDYRPLNKAEHKLKKTENNITVEFTRTRDILGGLKDRFPEKLIVGFAAESRDILENAKKKLTAKKLDIIVANDITQKNTGFGTDTNSVLIIDKTGRIEESGLMSKLEIARKIMDKVCDMY